MAPGSSTFIEAVLASLEAASAHNPGDAERPVVILWTDRDSQWLSVLPRLRSLMQQLLTLGEYAPEDRTGPSIWLRCVVERAVESPEIPEETTPVIYLPGVGRQEIGAAAETCPGPPQAARRAPIPRNLLDAAKWPGLDGGGVPGVQGRRARTRCSPRLRYPSVHDARPR